jgi:hypothetical protein
MNNWQINLAIINVINFALIKLPPIIKDQRWRQVSLFAGMYIYRIRQIFQVEETA